jgi:hypothetical protein
MYNYTVRILNDDAHTCNVFVFPVLETKITFLLGIYNYSDLINSLCFCV